MAGSTTPAVGSHGHQPWSSTEEPPAADVSACLERIGTFGEAVFTHVYLHQVGPDQRGFLEFARENILTRL